MSKIIRKLRLLKPHHLPSQKYKKGETKIPTFSINGKVTDIVHERGRVAPLSKINYENGGVPHSFYLVAVEGSFVGQSVCIGEEVAFKLGNAMKLKNIPEGTDICSVERVPNDGGKIAKSSGSYVTIIAHNRDNNTTTIKLPSGVKNVINSDSRAVIGVIAGGGVNEKPILKAGVAHYLHKARGIKFPRVRGVAMNPVEHPHGGGNHQHIGHPSTISKHAPPNQRVGLISARRTGLRRGSKKVLTK